MYNFPETKLNGFAFDIESTPNFFSVVFMNLQSDENFVFYHYKNINLRSALRAFIKQQSRRFGGQVNLYGFNSKNFDMPVLAAYLMDADPLECYYLSQSIIGHQRGAPVSDIEIGWGADGRKKVIISKPYLIEEGWWRPPYDLMQIEGVRNFDLQLLNSVDITTVTPKSLKDIAILLKWPWIKDLPYKYNHKVRGVGEVREYIDYNKNDVGITKLFAIKTEFEIGTRFAVEKTVPNLDAVNQNRSGLGNRVLERTLPEKLGITLEQLKSENTFRNSVALKDCISDKIVFESPTLRMILRNLKTSSVDTTGKPSLDGINTKFLLDGVGYQLGVGGLHTVDGDKPCVFLPESDEYFIDGDVASFYPFIMLNNEIYPEHLSVKFLEAFRGFVETRIKAKKIDKALADTLKIVINAIFGKMGSPTHWLYDPKSFLSVTLNGQMALLMWIDMLLSRNIRVFSANTDGVTARVKHSQMDDYISVCREWSTRLNYSLEFAKYDMVARRDVNTYMAVVSAEGDIDNDGIEWRPTKKTKQKGVFVEKLEFNKAARPPIIAKALNSFFRDEIAVQDTVNQSKDVYDFCMSQKVGAKFDIFFEQGKNTELQQKTIRWVYGKGTDVGKIVKINAEKRRTVISTYPAIMTNDLRNGKEENVLLKIDRDVYVKEIMKIVNVVNVVDEEPLF